MHSVLVIHRDLKLGNLFLSEGMELKVGDLGLAAVLSDSRQRRKTLCGTPNYIAPEIINGCGEGHSFEVDVWSFGVIAFALAVGKPPFQTSTIEQTYDRIKCGEYSFPRHAQQLSAELVNLVESSLIVDPRKRATAEQLLAHSYFKQKMARYVPLSTLACPLSEKQIQDMLRVEQPRSRQISTRRALEPRKESLKNSRDSNSKRDSVPKRESVTKLLPKSLSLYNKERNPYLAQVGRKQRHVVSQYKVCIEGGRVCLGYKILGGGIGVAFQGGHGAVSLGLDRILMYSRSEEQELDLQDCDESGTKQILLKLSDEFQCDWNNNKVRVYVKKWNLTDSHSIFKLNKNCAQVTFQDQSVILFDAQLKHVYYQNAKGAALEVALNRLLAIRESDFVGKVKQAKKILEEANMNTSKPLKENRVQKQVCESSKAKLTARDLARKEPARPKLKSRCEGARASFKLTK